MSWLSNLWSDITGKTAANEQAAAAQAAATKQVQDAQVNATTQQHLAEQLAQQKSWADQNNALNSDAAIRQQMSLLHDQMVMDQSNSNYNAQQQHDQTQGAQTDLNSVIQQAIQDQSTAQQSQQAQAVQQQQARDTASANKANADRDAGSAAYLSSTGAARNKAFQYFNNLGVDPGQYSGSIDDAITQALNGISPTETNLSGYLTDVGKNAYSSAQDSARGAATANVNKLFTPGFESSRISSDATAPILAGIQGKARASADDIISNMLKRGVITQTGATAATGKLNDQDAGVRQQLSDLGNQSIAADQQKLTDIASSARNAAGTLNLGTAFNPSVYSNQADKAVSDALSSLGDSIQSKVPQNLYDISGLSAFAGAGQGAQNTTFDPKALAGIVTNPNDPTDPTNQKKKQLVAF